MKMANEYEELAVDLCENNNDYLLNNVQVKVLVLDRDWKPVEVVSWQDAMGLFLNGRAQVIETHPEAIIRSARQQFSVPSVLRKFGKNQYSGDVPFSPLNIFVRDKRKCAYCGKTCSKSELTMDHIIPKGKGGKGTWDNLITSCKPCNQRKACRTPEQANMKLLYTAKKPKWSLLFALKLAREEELNRWSPYLFGLNEVITPIDRL